MKPWRVLVIDDDEKSCELIAEALRHEDIANDGTKPIVLGTTDFNQGVALLDEQHFDLLVLDVRLGSYEGEEASEAGLQALDTITKTRFLPIIFYTGLPHRVPDERRSALVRVVSRSESYEPLLAEIKSVFETRLPSVNRALIDHVREVQRKYMWEFVLKHWDAFGKTPDHTGLAYFLARRLALSLTTDAADRLAGEIGGDPGVAAIKDGKVHVHRMYVMPPVDGDAGPLAGAIFKGPIRNEDGHWVLLTPSCDIFQKKADRVVLAKCHLLDESKELKNRKVVDGKKEKLSNTKRSELRQLLENRLPRYYFLPAAFALPALLVDLQHLVGCAPDELAGLDYVGALDSPFAEALIARFTHYFGRVGTPDIDTEAILDAIDPPVIAK